VRFVIQEARTEEEVARCRRLAARAHGLGPDGAPADGWPERWLMGSAEGRLVATVGLAGRDACVRWFCEATAEGLARALRASDAAEVAELKLLSVDPALRGYRFARLLLAAAFSHRFLAAAGTLPALLHCAPRSAFRVLERALGVRSREVAGALGGDPDDPVELRLVVPEADVPGPLLAHPLPAVLPARTPARGRAGL
jgi:hypothetical protein